MRKDIPKIVENLVYECNTRNPFNICKKLGLTVDFVNYGKGFIFDSKYIKINKKYTGLAAYVICAHELGHAILHNGECINCFDRNDTLKKIENDRQANMFAAYLLFEDNNDIKFKNMNSYMLSNFINSYID